MDKIFVAKMTLDKMTMHEMIIDKMTIHGIIVDEMTVKNPNDFKCQDYRKNYSTQNDSKTT